MIFVTMDRDRARLESLTRLLVETFPGSTIYQHVDPLRAPGDVLRNRVDGVFLEAEMEGVNGIELMVMLHRQKPGIPVFILSHTGELKQAAIEAGAAGYFCRPFDGQKLKDTVLRTRGL